MASANRGHDLDLAEPMGIRAVMARSGLAPGQLNPYEDPERGWVDPLDDDEARQITRTFMGKLWTACLLAEVAGD